MTLANKITILRMIAIPFIVIALFEHAYLCARILFILSMISDVIDGALARFRGERTPLGSFLDPLADKLLLLASFITFTSLGWLDVWVFVAVLSRDIIIVLGWFVVFVLTGNRQITPRLLGKVTTGLQMAVSICLLFGFSMQTFHIFLYMMIAATIFSACDYVWLGNQRLSAIS